MICDLKLIFIRHLLSENDRGKIYSGFCNLEAFKNVPIAIKIIDFENTDINLDVIRVKKYKFFNFNLFYIIERDTNNGFV